MKRFYCTVDKRQIRVRSFPQKMEMEYDEENDSLQLKRRTVTIPATRPDFPGQVKNVVLPLGICNHHLTQRVSRNHLQDRLRVMHTGRKR